MTPPARPLRVYRPTAKQRFFSYGAGVLLIAGGVGAMVAVLLDPYPGDSAARLAIIAIVCLAIALLGAYSIAASRRKQVVLFADAIELFDLGYGRRRVQKDEIRGVRLLPQQQAIVFELRAPGRKPIKTDLWFDHDDVFYGWVDALPNLDWEDQKRAVTELLQRPDLGADEEDRIRSFESARAFARTLTGLTLVASAWGIFYPRPREAVLLMLGLIPIVALALLLTGRGRYATVEDRNDVRPSLSLPLILPGLLLVLRANLGVWPVDWPRILIGSALGGVVLVALIALADPAARRRWYVALGLVPMLAAYAWGALGAINLELDRSAPEVHRAVVLDKHTSESKGTHYHLKLGAWGPVSAEERDVHRSVYESAQVGGEVCARLRRGALGVRWYTLHPCDAGGPPRGLPGSP